MTRSAYTAAAFLFLLCGSVLAGNRTEGTTRDQAVQLLPALPTAFVENKGQIADPSARYVLSGSGANVFHTTGGPVFQILTPAGSCSFSAGFREC